MFAWASLGMVLISTFTFVLGTFPGRKDSNKKSWVILSFIRTIQSSKVLKDWGFHLLAPSGALIAIPTYYWSPPHFFRSHRSSTLDFHFLSHYSPIKAIMLYKGNHWTNLLATCIPYGYIRTSLMTTLAYSGIIWHTLAYSVIVSCPTRKNLFTNHIKKKYCTAMC